MRRLRFTLLAMRHRILCWLSASYRAHDAIRADRDKWRREFADQGNVISQLRRELRESEERADGLESSLALANEAQQNATEALISERALRQSAEERAAEYHDELVSALKDKANWLAYGYSRRPIFGGNSPAEDQERKERKAEMPSKRFAREISRESEATAIQEYMARLTRDIEDVPVGPEFSAG